MQNFDQLKNWTQVRQLGGDYSNTEFQEHISIFGFLQQCIAKKYDILF